MTKPTLTLTREQALAIIHQAIGPELVPVLDFLTSCAIADAHRDACRAHNDKVQRVPVVGELCRRKTTGEVVTVNRVTHVDVQCGYRDGLNVYHDMGPFTACFEPVYDATDAETDTAEEVGVKVGQVWVSKGVGNAATIVKLDGEFVEYRYHLSTETSRLSLDVFTANFFLPNA